MVGQAGGKTKLTADENVFGIMTQDPQESMFHSPGGLTDATGNSAWGTPFTLMSYFTHSTTYAAQTSTCTLSDEDMPYKVRVLGIRVRCVANRPQEFRPGYGSVVVRVQKSDGAAAWSDLLRDHEVGAMEAGDVKDVPVTNEDLAEIAADEGLRVAMVSKADSFGVNPTATFIVEVQCIRVL
jgi:hypothetical protein